jgi:hypothetical protein
VSVDAALAAAGYQVSHVQQPGGAVVLGSRRDFRFRWLLTQLKTSVVVANADHLTVPGLQAFVNEAWQLTKSVKGGLPNGLQSGVGGVFVISCETLDGAAAELASKPTPREWFKGISVTAVVVRSTNQVLTYNGRVLVGGIYMPFLRAQRDLAVAALVAA